MPALVFLVFQIDEEVAKLLELKLRLGDDGKHQFVLKTPKVRSFKLYYVQMNRNVNKTIHLNLLDIPICVIFHWI